MFDIGEMVERAMLLDLNNQYIDVDKVLYISEGKPCVYLDNLVKISDEGTRRFVIPEGIVEVYIDVYSDYYKRGIPYEFIFPASATFIGVKSRSDYENSIQLSQQCGKNMRDKFMLSTFDFRKCNKITRVYGMMTHMHVNKVLLNESVTTLASASFYETTIREVSAPGVKVVENNVFKDACITKLNIGRKCKYIGHGAFALRWTSTDELIFDCVTKINRSSFNGVSKLYFGDIRGSMNQSLKTELLKLAEDCDTLSMAAVLEAMTKLSSKYLVEQDSTLSLFDIQSKMSVYQATSIEANECKKDCVSVLRDLFVNYTADCKVYLFNTDSNLDVHSRRYKLILRDNSSNVELYVEE